MATQDIGNGVQMVDIAKSAGDPTEMVQKTLTIAELANKLQNAPLERKKLEGQIVEQASQEQLRQQQITEGKSKAALQAFTDILTGDIKGANERWKNDIAPGRGTVLMQHPDKYKAAHGFVLEVDPRTGEHQEINPKASLGIESQINIEKQIYLEAAKYNLERAKDRETFVRQTAMKLSEDGRVPDVRTGMTLAQNIVSEVNRSKAGSPYQPVLPGGGVSPVPTVPQGQSSPLVRQPQPGRPPGPGGMQPAGRGQAPGNDYQTRAMPISFTDQGIDNHLRSKYDLKSAFIAGSPDPLAVSLQKYDRIPEGDQKNLIGLKTTNDSMAAVINRMRDLKGSFAAAGMAHNTIQGLLSTVNAQDPRFAALKAITMKGSIEEAYRMSGTQYSDAFAKKIDKLTPQASDTLDVAMAKVSAVMGLNAMSANNTLSVLENNKFETGGMRRLFQGRDLMGGDASHYKQSAVMLMNALGPDTLKDRNFMEKFAQVSDPNLRDAVFEEFSAQGNPLPQGVINRFNRARSQGSQNAQ
jgi:hypothetical protein